MDKKSTLIYILVIAVIIIAAIGIYYYFSVQSPIAKENGNNNQRNQMEEPVLFEEGQAQQSAFSASEEKVKQVAENWIKNSSPTFKFDGMNLSFIRLQKLNFEDCPDCYIAEYEFKSRYAGYGDRAGEMLAQVIVPHSITLLVSEGKVTRAVTDAKYDEVGQEFINVGI